MGRVSTAQGSSRRLKQQKLKPTTKRNGSARRENDKLKQDLVRLTIEKSLLKCGLVEKLKYASNDVRYILTSYRFQKIKEIDSFRGESTQPIGDVFELPKNTWPISEAFYLLLAKKFGYEQSLKKLHSDFDNDVIPRGKYETLNSDYTKSLDQINEKLDSKYPGLETLVMSE